MVHVGLDFQYLYLVSNLLKSMDGVMEMNKNKAFYCHI